MRSRGRLAWVAYGLLIVILLGRIVSERLAGGVLEISEAGFDAGLQPTSEVFHHTFRIRNKGSKSLHLATVMSTCGCTSGTLHDPVLPAGQETVFSMDVTPKVGPQVVATALVFDELPKPLRVPISINGHEIHPAAIDAGSVALERPGSVRVDFHPFPGRAFQVRGVEMPLRYFDRYEVTREANGTSCSVHVFFTEKPPLGAFDEKLSFQTDDATMPVKVVRVSGTMLDYIEADRNSLSLGVLQSTAPLGIGFGIYSPAGTPFRIVHAESSVKEIAVDVDTREVRTSHTLVVRKLGNLPVGPLSGVVSIAFESRLKQQLLLDMFGLVK